MRRTGLFLAVLFGMVFFTGGFALGQDEILVGGTLALTGPFSGSVKPWKTLMDNYAQMINERGGIHLKETGKTYKLRFVLYDDQSNPTVSRKFYERLITVDKVHMLIGPYASPITINAVQAAEQHQVPFVAVCANATAIYQKGFKWLVGVLSSGELWSHHYFDMLASEGKAKTVAFLTEDHLHARDVYNGAAKYAKGKGFQVVFDEIASPKVADFTSAISKMKSANPDVVFVSAFEPFAITFIKQAHAQGLKPREFHAIHHGKGFSGPVGPLANGVTGEVYWMPGMTLGNVGFFNELLKRSGFTVEEYPWSAIRVPAMDVIVDALKRAGSLDRPKIMKALRETDLETIGGRIRFAPDGWGTMNTIVSQIQDGKYILVWPKGRGYPTQPHRYPSL